MTGAQREYYLRQQLKAIQEELGESDANDTRTCASGRAGEPARARAGGGAARGGSAAADAAGLARVPDDPHLPRLGAGDPWSVHTEDRLDPVEARRVLDDDHYDLDKVKERIVEYLAVRKLKGDMKGPSSASSAPWRGQDVPRPVDRAGDEPQVRPHLARRVRDEAEIRGHRAPTSARCPGASSRG